MRYFAVDTETTGLKKPRPIEIAAVCIDDFSLSFCERIKPTIEIEAGAQKVHGISKESLIGCRSEAEVMKDFLAFLEKNGAYTLVAHNASFDRDVIENALKRSQLNSLQMPWECTMEMSKDRLKKDGARHRLSDCCERAGIQYEDAHCALPDAIMCAKVFKSFFLPTIEDMWLDAGLAEINAREEFSDT